MKTATCAAILSFALLSSSGVYGATVTGTIKGPDGAGFRGAFIQAQNQTTKMLVSVLSDKAGHYRVENLQAGKYELQIRAPGYDADPRTGVALTAEQNASYDFGLKKGTVKWGDLSVEQGTELWPSAMGDKILPGKRFLVEKCFSCHGFQSRMAAHKRDKLGWRVRVDYMHAAMHFALDTGPFTDKDADDVASYLALLFSKDSILPPSPTELPGYTNVLRHFDDEAMKIVYVEYDASKGGLMPWSASPAKDGSFWIPYYGSSNQIGHLDPKTAIVTQYTAPNQGTAAIHSAMPAPDGGVWFTEQGSNKLGHWDPATTKITEYPAAYTPGKEGVMTGGNKHTSRIDAQGRIWTTGRPMTLFDPKTKKYTPINDIPTAYGLALDKDGNCWFAEYATDGKIGKIDAKTLKVTKWAPPSADSGPRRIVLDNAGIVWFAEYKIGKIGRFDPKTEKFQEFKLPGPQATPYALEVDDKTGTVWYSSENLDVIGNLDPKTGHVREYPYAHPENTMREFFKDAQGRMWFASPANNKVGYFYLASANTPAK